jgi:hypothetical protein
MSQTIMVLKIKKKKPRIFIDGENENYLTILLRFLKEITTIII